jgi:hypothetical protein
MHRQNISQNSILHVFNTILYGNEFQNPSVFFPSILLYAFPIISAIALRFLQRSPMQYQLFFDIISYQYHGPKSDILSCKYHFQKSDMCIYP